MILVRLWIVFLEALPIKVESLLMKKVGMYTQALLNKSVTRNEC